MRISRGQPTSEKSRPEEQQAFLPADSPCRCCGGPPRDKVAPMKPFELSVLFFLQLAAILVVCRIVSSIVTRLGQPPVVGEMIAGVCLGPSLFGYFWPATQE